MAAKMIAWSYLWLGFDTLETSYSYTRHTIQRILTKPQIIDHRHMLEERACLHLLSCSHRWQASAQNWLDPVLWLLVSNDMTSTNITVQILASPEKSGRFDTPTLCDGPRSPPLTSLQSFVLHLSPLLPFTWPIHGR